MADDKNPDLEDNVKNSVTSVTNLAKANPAATGAVIGAVIGIPAGPVGMMVCGFLGSVIGHVIHKT